MSNLVNRTKLLERMKFCCLLSCELRNLNTPYGVYCELYDNKPEPPFGNDCDYPPITLNPVLPNGDPLTIEQRKFFGGPSIFLKSDESNASNFYVIQGFTGFASRENGKKEMYIVFRGTDSPEGNLKNWFFEWQYNFRPAFEKLSYVIDKKSQEKAIPDILSNKPSNDWKDPIQNYINSQNDMTYNKTISQLPPDLLETQEIQDKIKKFMLKVKKQTNAEIKALIKKAKIHKHYWWQYAEDRGIEENERRKNGENPNEKWKTAQEQLHSIITQNRENIDEIIITGHSLGGSQAILCAWDLYYTFNMNISCFTFGNPRLGNKYFSKLMRICVPDVHRVVYSNDFGPTFPIIRWRFRHIGIFYHVGPKNYISWLKLDKESMPIKLIQHGEYINYFKKIKSWEDLDISIIESDWIEYKTIKQEKYAW